MIKTRHMAQVCREAMASLSGAPHWDDLSDRQRKLSVFIVNVILAEPESTPKSLHNAWMGEMVHQEGWEYGEVYDAFAKQHPNLTAFEELLPDARDAYAISIGIVRGLQAIGDRYEHCAPPQATHAVVPSLISPHVELPTPTTEPTTEPNTVTPFVLAVQEAIASGSGAVLIGEDGVHFVGQNSLVETTPESGDVPPATDPAAAE